MLCREDFIAPIPGSRKPERIRENLGAADIHLDRDEISQLDEALDRISVHGNLRMKIYPGSTVSQFRSVMSAPCTGRRVLTFTATAGADRGFIVRPGVPHDHKVKKMNNKEIVQRALKSLFEDYRGPASEFMQYFAPTFTMWANGNESDLAAFLAHFARLEVTVPDRTVEFWMCSVKGMLFLPDIL